MKSRQGGEARKERFILFGRYPIPGCTKTRLIPFLGPAGAAELQRHLTEKTFQKARHAASRRAAALEIRFQGGSTGKMHRWLGPGATYSSQNGGDLGERMEGAFQKAFQEGCPRAVLFGTDIPGLSAPVLDQAMEGLMDSDVVLGPSTDGGYWLMGLKKKADLFSGIGWGSEQVLSQTLERAKRLGLSTVLLDPLPDVDTVEDVYKLLPEWTEPRPYLSVIIPALDEGNHIKESVRHALCPDAQIVVVDGGSRDGTRQAALSAGAQVLMSPKGRGVQQNHGAEAARGRVLLFLHADTLLPKDYVHHIFETLLDRKAALGAFRFKMGLNKPKARVVEGLVNFRSVCLRVPYGDQAFFVRKTLFEKMGGFPEAPIGEDYFLVRRARGQGRIVISKAAVETSARRWQNMGFLRTTLINQIIMAGLIGRISPHTLASIYRRPMA
jgi:uncharacterized protein